MTAELIVQLDDGLSAALDKLAATTTRSREWLVERAIENYVSLESWQVGKILAGIEAADRGDFATDEEMETLFAKFTRRR